MSMNELVQPKDGENNTSVYYNYKDRVFRLLYKDRKRLLELYNALNGTDYNNEEDLMVNTLENAIFIKMKNDVSFIIDCDMCLYEHQSTYCPNMPLRGYLYFADLYKKQIKGIDLSVRKLIKIPTPHYIVFYNGIEKQEEEFCLRLSDAFEDDSKGCMELTVRVININFGQNKELLEKCQTLYGYAYFVAAIRRNLQKLEMEEAIEAAVNECIEKNILKEFLLEQKAEVIAMSIYEYNEEYVKKTIHEEGYEQGKADGEAVGEAKGDAKRLVKSVNTVMQNLKTDLEKACETIGTTVKEYENAKEEISK